jgi:hypothetical protein
MPKTTWKGTVMDAFLILMFGLLAVMAIPGLVFLIADLLGLVETHRISRHDLGIDVDQAEPDRAGVVSTHPTRRF